MEKVRFETNVDGDDLAVLWRALRVVGVEPSAFAGGTSWYCSSAAIDGLPAEGTADVGGLEILIERVKM